MAHGPRKKPLDFGGNPDHVTLGLEQIGVTVTMVTVRWSTTVFCMGGCARGVCVASNTSLQCSVTVGWAKGRASSL